MLNAIALFLFSHLCLWHTLAQGMVLVHLAYKKEAEDEMFPIPNKKVVFKLCLFCFSDK